MPTDGRWYLIRRVKVKPRCCSHNSKFLLTFLCSICKVRAAVDHSVLMILVRFPTRPGRQESIRSVYPGLQSHRPMQWVLCRLKRPESEFHRTSPPSTEVKNEWRSSPCSPCLLSWRGLGKIYLCPNNFKVQR